MKMTNGTLESCLFCTLWFDPSGLCSLRKLNAEVRTKLTKLKLIWYVSALGQDAIVRTSYAPEKGSCHCAHCQVLRCQPVLRIHTRSHVLDLRGLLHLLFKLYLMTPSQTGAVCVMLQLQKASDKRCIANENYQKLCNLPGTAVEPVVVVFDCETGLFDGKVCSRQEGRDRKSYTTLSQFKERRKKRDQFAATDLALILIRSFVSVS